MMRRISVCCVKEGDKYDSDYVNILHNMVKKYITIPFDFICLTEKTQGLSNEIKIINLEDKSIKAWWNKCLLFKPGLLKGYCLYLDLDVIILKNINEFLIQNQYLNILSNLISYKGKVYNNINSSMLFWNADIEEFNKIYTQYLENKILYDEHIPSANEVIGDQRVILDSNVKYNFFPSQKIRYMKFLQDKDKLDKNISMIICKGKKQKDNKSNYFVKKYWK